MELEKQKKGASNDDQRRDVEQKVALKSLERDLARAKWVRQISQSDYQVINNRTYNISIANIV